MANTQTSVPLFVANAVLTAAQQNISAATGVPVFATTVTRDAAFGGSNKALAEGQLAYIEASNVVQYYDGAAWATVGPSGTAGLVLVKAETAFTAQTSFNVANIFTSTYTNYQVNFRWFAPTATGGINVQLSVGGVAAATNYNNMRIIAYGASSLASSRSTAQTTFPVASIVGLATNVYNAGQLTLSGPAEANPTMMWVSGALQDGVAYITPDAEIFNGNHSTATAYDGLTILAGGGTITGAYTVYGYAKS